MRNKTYAPIECCHVRLQPDINKKLDRRGKIEFVDKMVMHPGKRRDLINYFAQTAYQDNEILKTYKLSSETTMKSIMAAVLPPPQISYGLQVNQRDSPANQW